MHTARKITAIIEGKTSCAILLNDNMDLHMSSLGTLVPEGPWYVFYAARCQVYGGLIYNVVFYWYPDITLRGQ